MKVLIATDGSAAAVDGATRGLQLLRNDITIEVTMVIPPRYDPMLDEGGFEGPVITEKEADNDYASNLERGNEALTRTVTAVGGAPAIVLTESDGPPADRIVALVAEHRADLSIIGSAERGFFSRLFHGSVSEHVVRHAHCPVSVIPYDHPESCPRC
jgi:nucleotide-binding universal stress UspA family protein